MKGLVSITLVVFTLLLAANLSWAEDTGPRNVIDFGCHTGNSICYVSIDGAPVGGEFGCSSNSVRWNADDAPSGKRLFAMVTAAFVSGNRVQFQISGCLPEQATFPTFTYASVTK